MRRRYKPPPTIPRVPPLLRWLVIGSVLTASSWAAWTGIAWLRYGRRNSQTGSDESDALLDRFMPDYEVADRRELRIAAPAETVFEAATSLQLHNSKIIYGIFKCRELLLGSSRTKAAMPENLLAWARALGWSLLGQIPGREVVFGAATRPWEADVVFRPLEPDDFAEFHEPGYAKIVWTLRVDPIGSNDSVVRTETRATTTDRVARAKFRRYWAIFSPGIVLIRLLALRMVKRGAKLRGRSHDMFPCLAPQADAPGRLTEDR
jgi:hypothetical protein